MQLRTKEIEDKHTYSLSSSHVHTTTSQQSPNPYLSLTMHAKSDSEVTSIDASTPPRSPPRRPVYYVQSPSHHDAEKMSYGSSPIGSPQHHYHCSPIHHSRESSSTTRFSASLKNPKNLSTWKKIHNQFDEEDADDEDEYEYDMKPEDRARFYAVCFVFSFVVLFTVFSLILWAASTAYKPEITVQSIVFQRFFVQSGADRTGVPTEMLTLNSTVRMKYRNRGTFFGVKVSATPMELSYYGFVLATGYMKEFSCARQKEAFVLTNVSAAQVPLYGGFSIGKRQIKDVKASFNLTFVVRSRAYVLGKLVKPKFYKKIRCLVKFNGKHLNQLLNLTKLCDYD